MHYSLSAVLCTLFLARSAVTIPLNQIPLSATIGTGSISAEEASPTIPYAGKDHNHVAWNPGDISGDPQPTRGTSSGSTVGSRILGPHNVPIAIQNPDSIAPPTTDHGTVYVT